MADQRVPEAIAGGDPTPERFAPDSSKYDRLRVHLQSVVAEMAAHEPLPTERELAEKYDVSRTTIRRTLRSLEHRRLIYRIQGAGTFVANTTVSKSLSLTSFSEDMRARGWTPGSRVITADEVSAGIEIGSDLQIGADEPVIRLVRVRLANDVPMCLESVYLPASGVPGLLESGLDGSLYERLDRYGERPARAEQVVTAMAVDGADAALLGITPGSPALRIRRIGLDRRDHPIERTVSIYRADRYDVSFAVLRDD